jgi:hypothetical protein
MKILLTAFMLCIIGCAQSDNTSQLNSTANTEIDCAPKGAKLIKAYESVRGVDGRWIKWELDGECFLSYNLLGVSAVITRVNCTE